MNASTRPEELGLPFKSKVWVERDHADYNALYVSVELEDKTQLSFHGTPEYIKTAIAYEVGRLTPRLTEACEAAKSQRVRVYPNERYVSLGGLPHD